MVDIAVCEMESKGAPCKDLKLQLVKVMVKKEDFVEFQECTEAVSIENAKKAFPDYEAFLKRNRFNDKNTLFLVSRLKNEADVEVLKPYVEKIPTGWVDLRNLNDADKGKVLANCVEGESMNAWNMLTFEETDAACARCPLAWNKGNCMGTFGPATSKLPEIAEKYGCPVIASAIEASKTGRKFTAEDAKELLRETELLAPKLIEEGKMAAHRYSGPVERLQLVAKACIAEGCGFFFI